MRSSFAMTEPPPGAGSDPSMMRTCAERIDGEWRITGRKWFITGAEGEGFGHRLADRETVRVKLGALAHRIETGRLLVMKAAWALDQGDRAKSAISMAKIQVAETLHRAADDAIQICGARGYSTDTVLEWIYRYARQARLVDGADEVHKMVLAQAYAREGSGLWRWGV